MPATANSTVQMILVAVQLETIHAAEPISTELLADDVPKPLPMTVNVVPKEEMLIGFTEIMSGVMATSESYAKRNVVVTEYMTVVVVG